MEKLLTQIPEHLQILSRMQVQRSQSRSHETRMSPVRPQMEATDKNHLLVFKWSSLLFIPQGIYGVHTGRAFSWIKTEKYTHPCGKT